MAACAFTNLLHLLGHGAVSAEQEGPYSEIHVKLGELSINVAKEGREVDVAAGSVPSGEAGDDHDDAGEMAF